jgi:hypothetical protein
MALLDQFATANDSEFQKKVKGAVLKAAVDVLGETKPNPANVKWSKRQNLAASLMSSINVVHWSHLVTTNAAITLQSTDNDIQFTVNTLFDDVSGVLDGDDAIEL